MTEWTGKELAKLEKHFPDAEWSELLQILEGRSKEAIRRQAHKHFLRRKSHRLRRGRKCDDLLISKISKIMDEQNCHIAEASEIAGVSPNTVYGWLRGNRVASIPKLQQFLAGLGYKLDIIPIEGEL